MVSAPLEVLERHPWLENLLSKASLDSASLQPDPRESTLLTAQLAFPGLETLDVRLTLRQAPDGTHQVADAQALSPRSSRPQTGFSYSRGFIVDKHRSSPVRQAQFSDLMTDDAGVADATLLLKAIELAQGATAWTPDVLDANQWYTNVLLNDEMVTLCVIFDDDTLSHAVDAQRYVPGLFVHRPRGRFERPFFEPWATSAATTKRRETIVAHWFRPTDAFAAWVAANPSRPEAEILDDALQACAELEQGDAARRSDGTLACCKPWGGDAQRHIYCYDTVLAGQDISVLMEFAEATRRVWKGIATLKPGEELDAGRIERIKLKLLDNRRY